MYGMFLGVWANPFLGPLIKHPSDTALDICPAAFAAAFPASNRCRENSVGVLRQLVALLDIRDPVIWELNCVESCPDLIRVSETSLPKLLNNA